MTSVNLLFWWFADGNLYSAGARPVPMTQFHPLTDWQHCSVINAIFPRRRGLHFFMVCTALKSPLKYFLPNTEALTRNCSMIVCLSGRSLNCVCCNEEEEEKCVSNPSEKTFLARGKKTKRRIGGRGHFFTFTAPRVRYTEKSDKNSGPEKI